MLHFRFKSLYLPVYLYIVTGLNAKVGDEVTIVDRPLQLWHKTPTQFTFAFMGGRLVLLATMCYNVLQGDFLPD